MIPADRLTTDPRHWWNWEIQRGIKEGLYTIIIAPTGVIGPYDFKPSRMGQVLLNICRHRIPALIDGGYN